MADLFRRHNYGEDFSFLPKPENRLPEPKDNYILLLAEEFIRQQAREERNEKGPPELVQALERNYFKKLDGTKYQAFTAKDIQRLFKVIEFERMRAKEEKRRQEAPQRAAERAGRAAEREAQRIADLIPQFHGSYTEQTAQLKEFLEAAKAKRTDEMRRDFLKINSLYEKIDSIIKGQQGSGSLKKGYEGWTDQDFKQFSDQLDTAYTILVDLLEE